MVGSPRTPFLAVRSVVAVVAIVVAVVEVEVEFIVAAQVGVAIEC